MEKIETEYAGFKITYLEVSNKWRIADDGEHGEKEKETLAMCKEWIDKIAKGKKQKYNRHPAILQRYGYPQQVTVTSFAGISRCSGNEFWITKSNGERSKESGLKVYSDESFAKLSALFSEKEQAEKDLDTFYSSLPDLTYSEQVVDD